MSSILLMILHCIVFYKKRYDDRKLSIYILSPSMMQEKYYDSRDEFERDLSRFAAFSRVFTRNYLYRIESLISEIQATVQSYSIAPMNKISLLYDILHMALAYYVRSLRSFPKHIALDKTMRLLHFVRDTVRICVERNYFDGDDFIIQVYLRGFFGIGFRYCRVAESCYFSCFFLHKTLIRKIDDTSRQVKLLKESGTSSKQTQLRTNFIVDKSYTLAMYGPAAHAVRRPQSRSQRHLRQNVSIYFH